MKYILLDLMNCCVYPHSVLLFLFMRTTLPRVFGAPLPARQSYEARSSKATLICNPILLYL